MQIKSIVRSAFFTQARKAPLARVTGQNNSTPKDPYSEMELSNNVSAIFAAVKRDDSDFLEFLLGPANAEQYEKAEAIALQFRNSSKKLQFLVRKRETLSVQCEILKRFYRHETYKDELAKSLYKLITFRDILCAQLDEHHSWPKNVRDLRKLIQSYRSLLQQNPAQSITNLILQAQSFVDSHLIPSKYYIQTLKYLREIKLSFKETPFFTKELVQNLDNWEKLIKSALTLPSLDREELVQNLHNLEGKLIKLTLTGLSFYRTEFIQNLAKLEEELRHETHELLYTYRKLHSSELAECKQLYIDSKLTQLNGDAKAELDKKFSKELEKEFKSTDIKLSSAKFRESLIEKLEHCQANTSPNKFILFKNICIEVGTDIFNEVNNILKNINKELYQTFCTAFKHNKQYNEKIEQIKLSKNISAEKRQELREKLKKNGKSKFNLSGPELTRILEFETVPLLIIEPETGNNLLHCALQNGRFDKALFLLNKKADPHLKNEGGITAINTKEKEKGNTLIHHLASIKNYPKIMQLIKDGADFTLFNNEKQSFLDMPGNDFLLHLIPNTSSRGNIALLVTLFESVAKISHLLMKYDSNNIILTRLRDLGLLNRIKEVNLKRFFNSEFQCDVNYITWKHLSFLAGQPIEESILAQLTFLSNTQEILLSAVNEYSDLKLIDHLESKLPHATPQHLITSYRTYLQRVAEQKKNDRQNLYLAPPYFIKTKSQASIFSLNDQLKVIQHSPRPVVSATNINSKNMSLDNKNESLRYFAMLLKCYTQNKIAFNFLVNAKLQIHFGSRFQVDANRAIWSSISSLVKQATHNNQHENQVEPIRNSAQNPFQSYQEEFNLLQQALRQLFDARRNSSDVALIQLFRNQPFEKIFENTAEYYRNILFEVQRQERNYQEDQPLYFITSQAEAGNYHFDSKLRLVTEQRVTTHKTKINKDLFNWFPATVSRPTPTTTPKPEYIVPLEQVSLRVE